jgi:hypothetical protein
MVRTRLFFIYVAAALLISALLVAVRVPLAQTLGEKERFTAVAIVNNLRASGAGVVQIDVTRWSTQAERNALLNVLQTKSADQLLDSLRDMKPVGIIKTPDSLGYDLRYANQTPLPDGGRRIVLATDRPIGFWEATHRPRTIDYPFTVIQMQIGKDGKGKGTLSIATKIIRTGDTIVLENFDTTPVMLTEIRSESYTE